jgi:hypothetical protein
MVRQHILALFCMCYPVMAEGQVKIKTTSSRATGFSSISIQPHIGTSWQSTLFKPVFDFSYIHELFFVPNPINFEKSTQGFGLDIGTTILLNLHKGHSVGIIPNARLRYDYVYGIPGFLLNEQEVKSFLLDYSTCLVYTYRNKKEKEWTALIGYTINQVGKKYHFDLRLSIGPDYSEVIYQYNSFNFGLCYDVYRISKVLFLNLSLIANYIPSGHPAYPHRDFMTLGIGTKIKFKPTALQFQLRQ